MEAWRKYLTKISTGKSEKIKRIECPCISESQIEDDMLFVKKTLTAAQIITLATTPIDLIGAPGVGKAIQVISAAARLNYNSVTFDTGTDLYLGCTSLATPNQSYQVIWAPFLNASATYFALGSVGAGAALTNLKDNDPISARAKTPNGTVGNSTIDIYVFYQIITL